MKTNSCSISSKNVVPIYIALYELSFFFSFFNSERTAKVKPFFVTSKSFLKNILKNSF